MLQQFVFHYRPEQAEENLAKKVPTKRQIHMENPPPELAGLSKNKLKKKLRNPYKNFDRTPGRESFDRCVECTNPRVWSLIVNVLILPAYKLYIFLFQSMFSGCYFQFNDMIYITIVFKNCIFCAFVDAAWMIKTISSQKIIKWLKKGKFEYKIRNLKILDEKIKYFISGFLE